VGSEMCIRDRSQSLVTRALTPASVSWIDRIFSPLVTRWVFLGQVLSADQLAEARNMSQQTGAKIQIPPKKVPAFTAGKDLKAEVS